VDELIAVKDGKFVHYDAKNPWYIRKTGAELQASAMVTYRNIVGIQDYSKDSPRRHRDTEWF
jgi:hypothetical protein